MAKKKKDKKTVQSKKKKENPIKKKEAAKKAATKRGKGQKKKGELKDKKRAVSKVTAKEGQIVEKKESSTKPSPSKEIPSKESFGTLTWEETKESLKKTSHYLFFEHRDFTMIVVTFLLCLVFLFTWQSGAEEEWQKKGWQKVKKELGSSQWKNGKWEQKVEQLNKLLSMYQGTGIEVYLLSKLAELHYQFGSKEKEEEDGDSAPKISVKELKQHLEKARELFERIKDHPLASKGVKLAASKNIEAITRELELLIAPKKPKNIGVAS